MGTEQFIASLVASLAWPATAASIIYVLRRPILRMLRDRQIQTLEAGPSGVKFSFFDDQIRDAKKELSEATAEQTRISGLSPVRIADTTAEQADFMDEMRQLAKISPRAVALESFARLEELLRSTVQVPDDRTYRFATMTGLAKLAVEQGLLGPEEALALRDLSTIRNVLSHEGAGELDSNRAISYAELISRVMGSVAEAAERKKS